MNAFKNHTTTISRAPEARHVIASLASELSAADAILATLQPMLTLPQKLHAKIDLQHRGLVEQNLTRAEERGAVLSMARSFDPQSQATTSTPELEAATKDLLRRLRTVAGQSTIKPPALDLEAADHIELLANRVRELAAGPTITPIKEGDK